MSARALHKVPGALGAGYLDAPMAEQLEWQDRGACQDMTWAFYPEGRCTSMQVQQAKKICLGCPVIRECRDWALSHHEEIGVWGGTSERERRAIWKRERSA